ncbi:MAG: ATPase, T2SS/T4P/T4SS family, partial [Bacillota bacterium]|nr:ATPase, T2SS/T4P/T4SS family [Bacillota bacterium]
MQPSSNGDCSRSALSYDEIVQLKLQVLEKSKLSDGDIEGPVRQVVEGLQSLSIREKAEAIRMLLTEIRGYGVIQKYLDDASISEIMINGMDSFFVERRGCIESEDFPFESEAQIRQLIYRIAAEVGREVNQAHPILDARLVDGSRVNIILPPLALRGAVITIRKFNPMFVTEREMIGTGMMTAALSEFLKSAVAARYNLFLCGGTGSGKTTLLNYLCRAIQHEERVITIEDAAEIDLKDHPHVISLETKTAAQQEYAVGMSRLIKNALRMRPDRIIVGEVRGEEV